MGTRSGGGGGLTSNQKAFLGLAAILVGPSLLKKFYEKPKEVRAPPLCTFSAPHPHCATFSASHTPHWAIFQAVDLSAYNIVTRYDTPAIERRDSTLRIEFCQS